MNPAQALVVSEDKDLVTAIKDVWDYDWPTSGKTKLVLTKLALANLMGVFKKVGGIQLVVAEELPNVAMEFIGAGLDGGIQ
ncbi:MAG: hypothetical protein WA517_03700, partial [Candidatus Acidiferrum sp.]